MTDQYRIHTLEKQAEEIYLWFHREAPDVKPQETGALAEIWRELDFLYSREADNEGDSPKNSKEKSA